MHFEEIPGLEPVKASLRTLVDDNRLPGALLLEGKAGGGQLPLALSLAGYALCLQPTGGKACGKCSSCLKVQKHIHPDLLFSFPYVTPKGVCDDHLMEWRSELLNRPFMEITDWLETLGAENKQGKIYAAECSAIARKLSLKTFEANRRFFIIWRPEFLGPGEGNRLLKLIEEPPEGTTFILVAENSELILPTILSRCQMVKVNAFQDEEVVDYLLHQKGMDPSQAAATARLAEGNLNIALQLAEEGREDMGRIFLDWFRACWKGDGPGLMEFAEQLASWSRNRQKGLLQYALYFLRELLQYKFRGKEGLRLNNTDQKAAEGLEPLLSVEQIEALTTQFSFAIAHLERNAHPKILFLSLGLRVHRIQRKKPAVEMANGIHI